MQGKLIVFEGIDGCGKTRMINGIYDSLIANNQKVVILNNIVEGSTTGTAIRSMLSKPNDTINNMRIALLYLSELQYATYRKEGIKDMLSRGYTVLCSRYYFSTYAYAGGTNDVDDVIRVASKSLPVPDKTIFLDVSVPVAMIRLNGGNDHFENSNKLMDADNKYKSLIARGIMKNKYIINNEDSYETNKMLLLNVIKRLKDKCWNV